VLNIFKSDRRRYPIKRDEYGRTARQRCFEAFDGGKRPAEVYKEEGVSLKTACTYFYQWKKLPGNFQFRYQMMKKWFKSEPGLYQETVELLSEATDQPQSVIEKQLMSPWGLRQLMSGEYAEALRKEEEKEQKYDRQIINKLIDALIEDCGVSLNDIIEKLEELLKERGS
jgi:hypothetical protein